MADLKLTVPLEFRRGSLKKDERASVESGLRLLDLMQEYGEFAGKRILDFGCGVKLAQALRERDDPQSLYVGLDVYRRMIDYLAEALKGNARYQFAPVDFHNAMYNKTGEAMRPDSALPIEDSGFDYVTIFSVITHMNPTSAGLPWNGRTGVCMVPRVIVWPFSIPSKSYLALDGAS